MWLIIPQRNTALDQKNPSTDHIHENPQGIIDSAKERSRMMMFPSVYAVGISGAGGSATSERVSWLSAMKKRYRK